MGYSTAVAPVLCIFLLACCVSEAVTTAVPAAEADRVIIRLKFKIHIVNGFVENTKPLLIRCHSNDDNLGEHTLWKGQEFRFHFGVHFIKNTHFVCDFEWGSKSLDGISVFRMGEETDTCKDTGDCIWKATEDGIYFSSTYRNWEKRYDWP